MAKDIILNNVRLSYAHLDTPKVFNSADSSFTEDAENGVYSAVLIIKKGSEAEKALRTALEELRSEALASGIKAQKKTIKITAADLPRYNSNIHDGDTKTDRPEVEDCFYINAKAKAAFKPAVYDKSNARVDADGVYSGCYVNAALRLYNYSAASNIGCGYGLTALQFDADGERLAGTAVDTDSIFGEKVVKNNTNDMF